VVNNVVLYNVLVDVDNADRQLMTGMSAQVFFVLGQARHVPIIPVAALGKRMLENDNDRGAAYRIKVLGQDQETEERLVHIGIQNRRLAEVRDGLVTGNKVILNIPPKKENDPSGYPRMPRL
jgi:macrolide-specific efflux system membrane fusion protein